MTAFLIARFSVAAVGASFLASCQSARTSAQSVHRSKLLYSAAAVEPYVDPPELTKVERKPEGLASRGIHRVAQVLSVVGRIPALPVTLMFGAMAGNEEALSSAGRFFSEPLP
jgi:hypothetical protein